LCKENSDENEVLIIPGENLMRDEVLYRIALGAVLRVRKTMDAAWILVALNPRLGGL
jgi:hypothetical protein